MNKKKVVCLVVLVSLVPLVVVILIRISNEDDSQPSTAENQPSVPVIFARRYVGVVY